MSGYSVKIVRNSDSEFAWVPVEGAFDEQESFAWSDGNYACDCKRHSFFERAQGREPQDDFPCGDTAYTCTHVTFEFEDRPDNGPEDKLP